MSKPRLVVLTGAGISAESGIPTFRASDGLWENHRIEDVASPEGWMRNPDLVLEFYNTRRRQIKKAQPNAGHFALRDLETLADVFIITQNIDDLHERSGSGNVLHLHGEILKARSSKYEQLVYDWEDDIQQTDRCEKGSPLRPHIVWFGEAVPMMEQAARIASTADIFMVVGTSMAVYPAASLIHYVRRDVPKFVVDPSPPRIQGMENLQVIGESATIGVPKLLSAWNLKLPV